MEFKEWWKRFKEGRYDQEAEAVHKTCAYVGWNAAIVHSNEFHELLSKCKDSSFPTEEDPTPTEMLKKLIELGWTIQLDWAGTIQLYEPNGNHYGPWPKSAYRKAFPKKVKKEIEVWYYPNTKAMISHTPTPDSCHNPEGWIKGTAIFWIDE